MDQPEDFPRCAPMMFLAVAFNHTRENEVFVIERNGQE
jgi:hypothetical protein